MPIDTNYRTIGTLLREAARPGGGRPSRARRRGVRAQPQAGRPLPRPVLLGGAKDARRNARALAGALATDRRAFREVDAPSPEIIELHELSRTEGT